METNSNSLLKREVDRIFAELNAKHGGCCNNPVTGGRFVWGFDPIPKQKKDAAAALLAREWFAINGPPDAPLLPLNVHDRDDFRGSGGLTALVGFYARSLSRQGYDVRNHPSFDDFARGLITVAMQSGLWGLEHDEALKKRFPPRPLAGMTKSCFWATPDEYEKLQREEAEYRRHVARRAVNKGGQRQCPC